MRAPRGRHAGLAVLLAVLAAAALAAPGTAQAPRSAEARDEAGDVRGPLDAVRVALARSPDGRLRGEVTMADAWTTADLRTGGAPASVCLRIFTKRDPAADPPDYLVCATAPREGDALVGRVLRDRANGLPRTVGDAQVSRPTARTVYLRFSRRLVGRPASVRFAAETVVQRSGCRRPLGCRDTAPDAPRTTELPLRSGSSSR